MRSEAKRHKHGHMSGDLHKKTKIKLREGRLGIDISDEDVYLSIRHAQTFRRYIKEKSKTQQRHRDQRACTQNW